MGNEALEPKHVRVEVSQKIKYMVESHYQEVRAAHGENRLVAFCGGPFPMELLRIMGISYVHLENYASACAARKVGNTIMDLAERSGYSPDLCSYARIGVGATLAEYECPVGGLPKPDLIVCVANICATIVKWCELLAQKENVPLFIIDIPYVQDDEVDVETLRYVKAQLQDLISFLEVVTGKRYDTDKARKVIGYVKEAARLRRECLELCKTVPSPMSSFDAFINLAPANTKRGTLESVEHYYALKKELEERIRLHISAIPGEKHRIYWDHIAIWTKLRELSEFFARKRACLVAAAYTHGTFYYDSYETLDPEAPLEGIAQELTSMWINRSLTFRAELIKSWIRDFKVNGAVFHSARTCKRLDFGQYDIAKQIEKELKVPTVIIEADHTDLRYYSEQQVFTRLEAFIESLEPVS